MTRDLVEEVARALATSKVRPSFIYQDAARAAIAIVLKRAAEVVTELPWYVNMSPDHIRCRKPEEYATAILSLGEQEKSKESGV